MTSFDIGDRIRVVQFFGSTYSPMVGMTGTVVKRNESPKSVDGYLYNYHVKLDRPAKAVPGYSKAESLTFLMYPTELEYEDNRKGAQYYDKIAYNEDYVRLSGDAYRACNTEYGSPLMHVFKLFSNVRVGDSAIIIKCINCGEVLGSSRYSATVTPIIVENFMYDNNQPSWPDVNTRLE